MDPPIVLVTGATGLVGRSVVPVLASCGYDVRAAVRSAAQDVPGASAIIAIGDLGHAIEWGPVLRDVTAVVHIAARVHIMRETSADALGAFRRINRDATAGLARAAAAAGVRRLVYVSSVKVMGESSGSRPFTEVDPAHPVDPYGISKWEAEIALREVAIKTGLEVVVVRPPLVHGPGVGGNLRRLMMLVRSGVPLPLASVSNRRSLVGVENLADFLARCVAAPEAAGETFFVSDGVPVSTPELIRMIADAYGRPARLFSVPPALLRMAGHLAGASAEVDRLLDPFEIDDSRGRAKLGWQPRWTLSEGVARMVKADRVGSIAG